jgi:hypothetical protein
MLDNAVAAVVPDVHAEGEVRLGFHGQVRLDLSWPTAIYTPMLLRRVAFPDFCECNSERTPELSPNFGDGRDQAAAV